MAPNPKRILFFDHTAHLGGGELALHNMVTHMNRARYEPVVLLGAHGPLYDMLCGDGIECYVQLLDSELANVRKDSIGLGQVTKVKQFLLMLGYARRMGRFIKDHDIDLVHTNSLKADIIGAVAARLAGKPLVWHVRDRISEDYLPRRVVQVFRWLCRNVPDRVIANSYATLETIGLPPRVDADVVYSGIGRALTEPGEATLKELDVEDGVKTIGLVGRIAEWKGQHIFIEAAARLGDRFPKARFQIIGAALFDERDYEARIREQAAASGLEGRVEFLGFCDDVLSVIGELDMLVHASTSGEPFGRVIVEGMALGKPVVATRGGGVLEIIDDEVNGLLVELNDAAAMAEAMGRLLSDEAMASKMGEAGRVKVRSCFTIERATETLESIYDEMLRK